VNTALPGFRLPHVKSAKAWLSLLASVLLGASAASAQMPNPSSVVRPSTFVSLDPAPQGGSFQAAVVVEIAKGFHMNSHKPSEDYLIPTTITADVPPGLRLVETDYPSGAEKKFAFSPDKPLNVYTDKVTLRLHFAVQSNAPVGAMSIPATLRYQACNDTTCLAPVKVPIVFRVDVAAEGTPGGRQHPDIFPPAVKKN
jgi:DsbC/DsbD-like thiol-disulfide interchange protein